MTNKVIVGTLITRKNLSFQASNKDHQRQTCTNFGLFFCVLSILHIKLHKIRIELLLRIYFLILLRWETSNTKEDKSSIRRIQIFLTNCLRQQLFKLLKRIWNIPNKILSDTFLFQVQSLWSNCNNSCGIIHFLFKCSNCKYCSFKPLVSIN